MVYLQIRIAINVIKHHLIVIKHLDGMVECLVLHSIAHIGAPTAHMHSQYDVEYATETSQRESAYLKVIAQRNQQVVVCKMLALLTVLIQEIRRS